MLLLVSFTIQSQTVINKDSLICFPKSVVREIQKDLMRKDLNDSIIKVQDSMIVNRNIKIIAKDSLIDSKVTQINSHKIIEESQKEQLEIKDIQISKLNDDLSKQKTYKQIFMGISMVAFTLGIVLGLK